MSLFESWSAMSAGPSAGSANFFRFDHAVPLIGSSRIAATEIRTDGVEAWLAANGRSSPAPIRTIAPVAIQSRQRRGAPARDPAGGFGRLATRGSAAVIGG